MSRTEIPVGREPEIKVGQRWEYNYVPGSVVTIREYNDDGSLVWADKEGYGKSDRWNLYGHFRLVEDAPAEEPTPERNSIIDEVAEVVAERGKSYSDPTWDFVGIAIRWTMRTRAEVTPMTVAWMMNDLKANRAQHSPVYRDNRLDTVGYMDCLDRIVHKWETDPSYSEGWNKIVEGLRLMGVL
jgi:hypothetical protein